MEDTSQLKGDVCGNRGDMRGIWQNFSLTMAERGVASQEMFLKCVRHLHLCILKTSWELKPQPWCHLFFPVELHKTGNDIKERTPADHHDCLSRSISLLKYRLINRL